MCSVAIILHTVSIEDLSQARSFQDLVMAKRSIDESDSKGGLGGWEKCFSKTYNAEYWFNSADGTKSWTDPHKKTKNNEEDATKVESISQMEAAIKCSQPKVAIIVPYRDASQERTREHQLQRFVPEMCKYLDNSGANYEIFIIEQSDDKRKFNRGKLLNIGFDIACKHHCSILIFHDVDLLPSQELQSYYLQLPTDKPIHIARVWDRYNANPSYFGGVVSFSKEMFERVNGFPNTFWGWGGEDDELFKRTVKAGLTSIAPTAGSLTDMEDMNLDKKLAFLRTNKILKCMNKHEVLAEHDRTWRTNGLKNLHYKELSRVALDKQGKCLKITVDVELNNHWTDERCGIADTQL